MNFNELETDWSERGFTFGIGTIKANDDGIIEALHDDKDELVFMESGRYKLTIDGETFIHEGNVEIYIPAGVIHSIKNIGSKESKIYYGYKSIKS